MVAFPVNLPDEVAAVGVISSETPIERPAMIRSVLTQAGGQLARVAERDRASAALAEARDVALEANRLKSDFLATMSHEIRTPLNGVIGLNDLLLRTELDADQQRLATGIQVSSRALLGLINDVLDFSKIEAGHLELEQMDFDLRGVLDQVASVLGEPARARGLDLLVGCDADVPAMLAGDPTRLAQVLTNLGSNAVKFTEAGHVTLRVSLADDEPASAPGADGDDPRSVRLLVQVTDTGVGIPAAQREAIFDPFAQAEASTTRRFGGTGLGLAICREIVAALGGEIGVDATDTGGSRFWFTAWFRPASGEGVSAEDRRAREALAGHRVLVVDDNEQHRMILSEQVGWWGVHCTSVTSVAEAMEALRAAGPGGYDLVLLDLAMPERDGFDLAAEVRASPELGAIVLVMLSSTLPPGAARLREAGIAGGLTKPVLASTLRALLLRYLAPEEVSATVVASLPRLATVGDPAEDERDAERPRVLVVEDNPVNQMVAAGLLDGLGYDSDVVDDGDTALQALDPDSWGRYRAVLMDLQMPRMDGVTATRALREREAAAAGGGRLPVIAMTASVVRGERERCLEAGMDDFVAKPVDPRALASVMDRWLLPGERASATDGRAPGAEGGPTAGAPVEGGPLDHGRLEMLRELDDGGEYLVRVIDRLETNHLTQLASVADAVTSGDPVALRSAAHALKGTMTNIGLTRVGEIALELEQLGAAGLVTGAAERLPALRVAVEEGVAALLAYRQTLGEGVGDRG